jgi:cell division protein FtsW
MPYLEEIDHLQKPAFKGWGYHTKGDKVIWALVVLLALISMLVVYSATGSLAYKNYKGNTEIYLFKQVAFIVLGIVSFILPIVLTTLFTQRLLRYYSFCQFLVLIYTCFLD